MKSTLGAYVIALEEAICIGRSGLTNDSGFLKPKNTHTISFERKNGQNLLKISNRRVCCYFGWGIYREVKWRVF